MDVLQTDFRLATHSPQHVVQSFACKIAFRNLISIVIRDLRSEFLGGFCVL